MKIYYTGIRLCSLIATLVWTSFMAVCARHVALEGNLAFQIISYDCNSGVLQYQFTSSDNSPVSVSIPGVFGGMMNPNSVATYTFPGDGRTGRTITVTASQPGTQISISYTNGCGNTPPPSNPPTNPPASGNLAFQIVSYDCNSGVLQYQFTGGNGSAINVSIPGVYGGSTTANTVLSYTFPPDGRQGRTVTGSATQSGTTVNINFTNGCNMPTNPNPPNNLPANPNPPGVSGLAGNLDYVSCNAFSGWVMNQGRSTKIDIYVNGWLVASNILAIRNRPDVASANGVSGYTAFGFDVRLPKIYKRGVPLTISVKYAGTNTDIPGSPKTTGNCTASTSGVIANSDCDEAIAVFLPGSERMRSSAFAHTGTESLQIGGETERPSSLISKLVPLKKNELISLQVYALSPFVDRRNLFPEIATALAGGIGAGIALMHQPKNIDKLSNPLSLPAVGISTVAALPLAKSLLSNRFPDARLELAYYDKQGKFIRRKQIKVGRSNSGEWHLLSINDKATEDSYAQVRLINRSKSPLYFDDLTVQKTVVDHLDNITTSNDFAGYALSEKTAINSDNQISPCNEPFYSAGGYGAITDWFFTTEQNGILLDPVVVTAPAPVYAYSGGVIYTGGNNAITPTPGSPGTTIVNGLVGQNLDNRFDQQMETTKQHFCQQAAQIRAQYATPPNWASPGTPQSGQVLAILGAFIRDVKSGAPYDLKTHGYDEGNIGTFSNYYGGILRFDDYGNINFGLAAAASGIPLSVALCGAGMYQWLPGSGPIDSANITGCLDDSRDTAMIQFGYQLFRGCDTNTFQGIR